MKRLVLRLIRFYRTRLSPLKPPCCRFTPTCSSYAAEAFQKRGFFSALILTLWRILRCNPFCRPGYDPVPAHGFRREVTPKSVIQSKLNRAKTKNQTRMDDGNEC